MSALSRAMCLLLITSASVNAQSSSSKSDRFDVVSVKLTGAGGRGGPGPFVNTSPGRLQARGRVIFFIEFAYGIWEGQIDGGPDWIRSDRFDLEAVMAAGSSMVPTPAMLQPVLADRFGLRTHRVTRDVPIFALVVGKSGPKLQKPEPSDEPLTRSAPGRLIAQRISMRQLASHLTRRMGRPVEDRTNLSGEFNFTLTYTSDEFQRPDPLVRPLSPSDGSAFTTALDEQLGLRLTNAHGKIEVLVVDRVEKPTPN